jgi:hypothetical protein
VSRNRTIVNGDRAQLVPRRARDPTIHERAHFGAFSGFQKQPGRADELERIPLDRIVARRNHEAAGGMMVLDGELAGGRGGETDVDHVAADRLKRGQDHPVE